MIVFEFYRLTPSAATYAKYQLHVSVGVVILRAKYSKSRFAYRTRSVLVRIMERQTFTPFRQRKVVGQLPPLPHRVCWPWESCRTSIASAASLLRLNAPSDRKLAVHEVLKHVQNVNILGWRFGMMRMRKRHFRVDCKIAVHVSGSHTISKIS